MSGNAATTVTTPSGWTAKVIKDTTTSGSTCWDWVFVKENLSSGDIAAPPTLAVTSPPAFGLWKMTTISGALSSGALADFQSNLDLDPTFGASPYSVPGPTVTPTQNGSLIMMLLGGYNLNGQTYTAETSPNVCTAISTATDSNFVKAFSEYFVQTTAAGIALTVTSTWTTFAGNANTYAIALSPAATTSQIIAWIGAAG